MLFILTLDTLDAYYRKTECIIVDLCFSVCFKQYAFTFSESR